jgi:hypothetical protein
VVRAAFIGGTVALLVGILVCTIVMPLSFLLVQAFDIHATRWPISTCLLASSIINALGWFVLGALMAVHYRRDFPGSRTRGRFVLRCALLGVPLGAVNSLPSTYLLTFMAGNQVWFALAFWLTNTLMGPIIMAITGHALWPLVAPEVLLGNADK